MAASFGAETPILSYGPRAHAKPGARNDRVWLLWPAWAFRVVVPELRARRLNVLQRAVLGVLRASRLTALELGQRLGIHGELGAFVVTELQALSLVDEQWNVTGRGLTVLDEEHEEPAALVPRWVFSDPWSGTLWPFVAPTLEYARVEWTEAGQRVLDLGTTGKPWRQHAWAPRLVREREGMTPDAREVLRAALGHARLERRAHRLEPWVEEGDEVLVREQFDMDRISTIEDQPEPVFLVTYLYVPEDADDGDLDWHACDFFGRGSSPALRKLVERVAKDEQRLAKALNELLGRKLHEDLDGLERAAAARARRSRDLLEATLTIDIRRSSVAEPLQELLESWLEVRALGEAAAQWRRRAVVMGARTVLERLLRELSEAWPLAGVADRLSREDVAVNEAVLRGAAKRLGLAEIPPALTRVTHGQVRAVSNYGDAWRLRALVVATMLRASDDAAHPLGKAARRAPDVLSKIERITALAGNAAHDGTHGLALSIVSVCVEETLAIIALLLNLPARPLDEVLRNE